MNFEGRRLHGHFMINRLRRLRSHAGIRKMVQEHSVSASNLVYPMFVVEGLVGRREVTSMPGIAQLGLDEAVREAAGAYAAGVPAILLFGIPAEKSEQGEQAWADDGIVQQAIRSIKAEVPELVIVSDICLCEYTSHGHCGLLNAAGQVLNDETVELLCRSAVSHARAGADVIAPSDMMDLRVGAIRESLDEAGFTELTIMSYAVKYASAFYGPFRDAAQSTPSCGDRKGHQMNPANWREAMREAEADLAEGADILMVKPGLPYLDVLTRLRERFDVPLAIYQVSGEYSMIKAAAERGWIDEPRAVWESLVAMRRAGADIIITYYAKVLAEGGLEYKY